MSERNPIVHPNPVWRDRSDFIIGANTKHGAETVLEQLWAKQLGSGRFELCCIPFFAYNLDLGDLVDSDESHVITSVIQPSGRYVFRIWFENEAPQERTIDHLMQLGSLIERSSQHLIAVDAADDRMAQAVAEFLQGQEASGVLTYETGRS